MSIAVMMNSTALAKSAASKVSSSLRNFSRLSDARLHEELSSDMYSEHGLDAVMRPVSGLVCQSLIVSSYCRPGSAHSHAAVADLAEQVAGVDGLDDLAGAARAQPELGAVLDRAHELVADADRVVGVLVLHGGDVGAAEVHVEAGVAQGADLVLLARLGHHELLDVRVVDVEDDHLGRTTRGAARLDGARGRVGAAHEGDRTGRRTAGGEELLGGADAGEVEAGAGAALEDEALLLVPVEDRVHRVVDREDEAGRDLLRRRGADVEPHRGVEGEVLVDQQPGQLVLEDLGVAVGRRSSRCRCRPWCRSSRPGR